MTLSTLTGLDYWSANRWLKRMHAEPSRARRAELLSMAEAEDGKAVADAVKEDFARAWADRAQQQEVIHG